MLIFPYKNSANGVAARLVSSYVARGDVVAYPTETSYGLGVDATNIRAIRKLYACKQRPDGKPVHIAVASRAMARTLGTWDARAEKLARAFWPGPLTIVVPLREKPTKSLELLAAGTGMIGMRMPAHPLILSVLRACKKPITATSANPSREVGGTDAYSGTSVWEQFQPFKIKPDLLVDAGVLRKRRPSTVVALYTDGSWSVLRKGPVSAAAVREALR